MSRLPVVSGREAAGAFEKIGYEFDHQSSSHIILRHRDPPHRRLSVPDHREVAKGTLRSLIRQAGIRVLLMNSAHSSNGPTPSGGRALLTEIP